MVNRRICSTSFGARNPAQARRASGREDRLNLERTEASSGGDSCLSAIVGVLVFLEVADLAYVFLIGLDVLRE